MSLIFLPGNRRNRLVKGKCFPFRFLTRPDNCINSICLGEIINLSYTEYCNDNLDITEVVTTPPFFGYITTAVIS